MQISQCAIDMVYADGMVCRRRGMKNAVLAVAVTAGVGGFALSTYAQDVKKLPDHPAAAADRSLQQGKVVSPAEVTSAGGVGSGVAKPKTGVAVAPGGESAAQSKQHK
jgi:hypothetical protein